MSKRIGYFACQAWIFVCLLLLWSSTALAASEIKVAVVDMEKALQSSKSGLAAQKQFETEVKEAQNKIDAKKAELEKLQQSFAKQRESLNAKARGQKEEELINLEKELRRSFQDTQDTLKRRNSQLVGELLKKIKVTVEEIGKADGYTLILAKSNQSILFADQAVDITEKVVEEFNGKTD